MKTDVTQGHVVLSFNDSLSQLRGMVLEMGELVVEQIKNAVKSLLEGDQALAHQVIERDREVDRFDLMADEAVMRVIATRAPVGIDLRLVHSLSRISLDLERAGDEAKKIAKCTGRVLRDAGTVPGKMMLRDVHKMTELACCMLESSLDAVAKNDVECAIKIIQDDPTLDQEFDAGVRYLSTYMIEDPASITMVLNIIFILKALERIGDHAKNICESVIFVARGRDIRHPKSQESSLDELLQSRDGS
ncbi:Phosphate-specific transport system accessory protein PhoU homolog [Gammaproteobacteria bacterium]